MVDRALDRRADGLAQHHHREPDVHVDLDAVLENEDAAGNPLAVHAQVIALPLRAEPQLAAEFFGDAIDAPPGFLDAEGMFAFDLQSAAA